MGSLSISDPMIRSVAVDPQTPQRVYAAGPEGLGYSDDGGLTWTAAGDGLPGESLAVTLNPSDPQTIFAVLTDDSVWQSVDGAATWEVLWQPTEARE